MSLPQCINRCVPMPVGVTVNQNLFVLGGGAVSIVTYVQREVQGTAPVVELPYKALAGFEVQVFVNGVLQQSGEHYNIDLNAAQQRTLIQFQSGLEFNGETVTVVYAEDRGVVSG